MARKGYYLVLLFVYLFDQVRCVKDPLKIVIGQDGSYNVTVLDAVWLRSAPTFFTVKGRRFSVEDDSLVLETINTTSSGEGPFGVWFSTDFHYHADGVKIIASIVEYATEIRTFKVSFPDGATNTSNGVPDDVICGFPGFRLESEVDLGVVSLGGSNAGFEKQYVGRWNHDIQLQNGLDGSSPIILFDRRSISLTFGPLDNFLSTSMWQDKVNNHVYWGIMGGVEQLPVNFSYQMMATFGGSGVTDSFTLQGFIIREMYYKIQNRPVDKTVDRIGYWTDQGSYYYMDPSSNYQDTLLRVLEDARNNSIYYSYMEWDTWAFHRGQGGGVKSLLTPSGVFPSGPEYVQKKLNVNVINKLTFWSSDTIYAKQNGGQYNFDIVGDMALPLDEEFWDFVFSQSRAWGAFTFIQANMTDIFNNFPRMKTDVNYARDWLKKMATSAQRHNTTLQFSDVTPRLALEAMELPAVTQLKISPSFGSSADQWKIGLTSMFGGQLALDLFKDVFLTSSQGAERESLVATLSGGPVGIGDQIGHSNLTIISRTSSADGTILKPNIPALATSAQIMNIPKSKIFSPRDPSRLYDFSDASPFSLPPCNTLDYCLYYTAPTIDFQIVWSLVLNVHI